MKRKSILFENCILTSDFLHRDVIIDFYCPDEINPVGNLSLLLINDGQLMEEMKLIDLLEEFCLKKKNNPFVVAAIHAGKERKMEYGVASVPDYKGRGAKAGAYTDFVLKELLPFTREKFSNHFSEISFVGFSLGGLMALDMVWNNPDVFSKAAAFSGSFWWRSVDQHDEHYDDDKHRIIHQQIRKTVFKPGLKFFFQCGNMDEKNDRNKNGVIDSIDDTLDLVDELVQKGYDLEKDIYYLEMKDGRHDEKTWAKAFPVFLEWAFSNK